MKTLVLYVFCDINDRVSYFIKNGLFYNENIKFLFICNNKNILIDLPHYVDIIYRENIGFDFGGWSYGLLNNNYYNKFDNFIFINSSVYGPILPIYFKGLWTDIFISSLNEDIKLFGCTINNGNVFGTIGDYTHVQSFVFCMNKETLEFLIEKNIFTINSYIHNKYELINKNEIGMSQLILKNNWNIGCLMKYYHNIDFRKPLSIKPLGDVMYNNSFMGESIHPYEVIFIKGNRNFNDKWLQNYIK